MISADGKTNVKQYEVKEIGDLYLINFCKKSLQNLTYNVNVKRSSILHLILFGVPSRLILSVKNRGCEGGGGGYIPSTNASMRRAQLSITATTVRSTDLLNCYGKS